MGFAVSKVGKFIEGILSDAPDSPSATRLLMLTFATFAIVVMSSVIHHMLRMPMDLATLSLWVGFFPVFVGVLSGLIVLPYTIGQGMKQVGHGVAAWGSNNSGTLSTAITGSLPPNSDPQQGSQQGPWQQNSQHP